MIAFGYILKQHYPSGSLDFLALYVPGVLLVFIVCMVVELEGKS